MKKKFLYSLILGLFFLTIDWFLYLTIHLKQVDTYLYGTPYIFRYSTFALILLSFFWNRSEKIAFIRVVLCVFVAIQSQVIVTGEFSAFDDFRYEAGAQSKVFGPINVSYIPCPHADELYFYAQKSFNVFLTVNQKIDELCQISKKLRYIDLPVINSFQLLQDLHDFPIGKRIDRFIAGGG